MWIPILLGVLLLAAIAIVLRPRPLFVIEIRNRKVRVRRGKVPRRFLADLEAMMSTFDVPDCTVKGFGDPGSVKFRFPGELPKRYHQHFRNLWHNS